MNEEQKAAALAPAPDAAKLVEDARLIVDAMRKATGDKLPSTTKLIDRLAAALTAQEERIAELEREAEKWKLQACHNNGAAHGWAARAEAAERQRDEARAMLREAIEFAEQDCMALTPIGSAMVARWLAAIDAPGEGDGYNKCGDGNPKCNDPHCQPYCRYRSDVPAPGGGKKRICDCERGHNGLGLAGRECDCAPPAQGGK